MAAPPPIFGARFPPKNNCDLKRAEEQSPARRGIVVRKSIPTRAVATFVALELPSHIPLSPIRGIIRFCRVC